MEIEIELFIKVMMKLANEGILKSGALRTSQSIFNTIFCIYSFAFSDIFSWGKKEAE